MQTIEGNVTRFERLGLEDGLSEAQITAVCQDSQGFLWIGTQDGLNKYDGYTFTIYRHDPTDPTSLSTNVILAILEDSEDALWLGTDRGLVRFDKRSEVFTPYPLGQKDRPGLDQVPVRAMLADSLGALWIGTKGQGLYRLERRTGDWTAFRHDPENSRSLPSNRVTALLEDGHGLLWVGTHGGGLGRLDRQRGEFTAFQHRGEDRQSLSSNSVTALWEDSEGILWVGTETGGLNGLDTATQAAPIVRYQHKGGDPRSLSHDYVLALLEDSAGTLWVGTGRGLNELDRERKRFRGHYHEEGDLSCLSHSEIFCLAEDAQGLLWIGTRTGLNKFDRRTRAFGHLRRGREAQGTLSSNMVTAFLEDAQGFLWIGTYGGGLNRSTTNGTLEGFFHCGHREDDPHSLGDRQGLPDANLPQPVSDNGVFALCEDARGRLWIGTGAGLHRLVPGDDPASPPTFARYRHEPENASSLSNNHIASLARDDQGNLWIGTYGGLNRLNQADAAQGFARYLYDENDPHSLSHDFVRCIHADSAGSVWIATDRGLNRLVHADDGRFVRYRHDRQDPHSLSHDRVYCIAEDAQGNLWIGTYGGLNRLDPRTGWFTAYREKDGLSNDAVYGLLVDERGLLWLATNRGIDRFDPTTERFTHYDAYDGLQGNEFTQGAFYKDRRGRLYFGGDNGLNVFHPGDIQENPYVPPVVLTSFLLANKPVPISESGPLKEQITCVDQIELAPEDYSFAFEFSALNYRQPHKNCFAYQLEGFDRDWVETSARDRKAVYTNVPPGTYTFRVKAANDDGLWNEDGTSIQLTVSQPWWHILFRSSFEAVMIHDQGTILQVNQAALDLYGYEQADLIGQSVYMLIPPDARDEVAGHIAAGDETPYESKGVRRDGTVFISEVRARGILYQGRQVRVAAVRDITDRKQAEQALEQRVRHEQALAACSRTLLQGDGTQSLNRELLNQALSYLMEAVQASRASVFRNFQDPEDGFCCGIVAEAVAPGQPRNLENPHSQKIPWSLVPEENRLALEAGKAHGGPTEQLFASTPGLRDALLEQSILSAQLFPIHFGDEWWGYVGFDDCQIVREWGKEEVLVLRTASQMIASALQRWQAEADLQQAHDELEQRVQARTAELNAAVGDLRREILQRQRAEAETRERLIVQQGLAGIATRLMRAPAFDEAVVDVLAQTGALLGADRVFLVRLQADGQTVNWIHEWCAPGLAPIFEDVEGWSLSGVSGWLEDLQAQGWFYAEDRSQIPSQLQERVPLFAGDGRGGYGAVPVYARKEMIGFLACHGLASTGQDLEQRRQVLEVLVGILGSAWLRERVLETLDQRVAARTRELSTFFKLTSLAFGAQNLADMLAPVPRRILELGSCDALCIHLVDAGRSTLTLAAQGNLSPGRRPQLQAITLDDDLLQRFERFEPLMLTENTPADRLPGQLLLDEFPSYLGVPFPGGWVSYYRTSPHGFSLDESSLLTALAEQVGMSVENYRLRQRIGDVAVLEERQRLARDLHDSVTQSLFMLALYASGAQDAVRDGETAVVLDFLSELERNALRALREMRLLLYELRPEALEQEGLIRSLERRFDTVERRTGTDASVIYRAQEELHLPHSLEREIYYVAMEALNNTLKHAQATEVTVRIEIRNSELWMEVSDNGCGFDPRTVSQGLGLHDMQERVERLGGRLQIASEPGVGTRAMVWIDLGAA